MSRVQFLKLVHFGQGEEVIKGSLRGERTSLTTMPHKVPPLKGLGNVSITARVGTRCTQISGAALSPLLTDYVMRYGSLYGCIVFCHRIFPSQTIFAKG